MERYPPESTVRRRNSEATETLPPIGSQTSWPGDDGADGLLNETAAPLYSAFGGMASSQSGPISTPVQFLRDGELRDALLSYNYAVFAAANNTELLLSRTGRYGQIMPAIFHTNRTELLRDPLPKSTRRAAPHFSQGRSHDMINPAPPSTYSPHSSGHSGVPAPGSPLSLPLFPNPPPLRRLSQPSRPLSLTHPQALVKNASSGLAYRSRNVCALLHQSPSEAVMAVAGASGARSRVVAMCRATRGFAT